MTQVLTMRAVRPLLAFLLVTSSLPAQETPKPADHMGRHELQRVLREARDAVVRLAAEDDSTSDASISDKVQRLVESLLYLGDREDVRYLQRHLKKVYAKEIRSALEPSAQRKDFASRLSKADHVKDIFEHDQDLETIVKQEIERGFLEDAVDAAQRIRLPGSRSTAFIDIAIAQHGRGNDSAADDAVTWAIRACFQPGTDLPLMIDPTDRRLAELAAPLAGGGYLAGAQRVLVEAEKAVETKATPDSFDWSNLTEAAIAGGDLTSAARFLKKIEDEEMRGNLRARIALSDAQHVGTDAALQTATKFGDPRMQAAVLRDIASKQSDAGDDTAAITTLRLAIEASHRAKERTVLLLHDVAWAQIGSGDRIGAEQTLEWALKENEEPAFGQDQVDAWALLADTFAFLGHFDRAHQIASKIDDHFFRGRALGFIAQREVEAGRSEEALAWAMELKDPNERASTYLAISETTIEKLKEQSKK